MDSPLSDRDFAFVEGRLLSPVPQLMEVIERLEKAGHVREADRLRLAGKALLDTCRDVRYLLIDQRRDLPRSGPPSPRRIGGGAW